MKLIRIMLFVFIHISDARKDSGYSCNQQFIHDFLNLAGSHGDTNAPCVTKCLKKLALEADKANITIWPVSGGFRLDQSLRKLSVHLETCLLKKCPCGRLRKDVIKVFAPFFVVAKDAGDVNFDETSKCAISTKEEIRRCSAQCKDPSASWMDRMEDLKERTDRCSRREESSLCKVVRCVGECIVQKGQVDCGNKYEEFLRRLFKNQMSAALSYYMLRMSPSQSVNSLPCQCKWFFGVW